LPRRNGSTGWSIRKVMRSFNGFARNCGSRPKDGMPMWNG
jgi:hypothetical protein